MKQDYIIVPQNYKKSLIKKLSKQNNLYKAKILGIDEVTKKTSIWLWWKKQFIIL